MALVELGSARRVTAGKSSFETPSVCCAMRPTALGVGVEGGGAGVRFFGGGVNGEAPGDAFLLRVAVGGGGGGMISGEVLGCLFASLLIREDRLVAAMVVDV